VKQKYGKKISWADLMIFAGNCAIEDMGLEPFGFAGGRVDIWAGEEDVYWGAENEMGADERHGSTGFAEDLEKPLGASQMGLIYVNPQGPGGNPEPLQAAKHIRDTFGRMGMNDEDTVALIAGGHTFGKAHGAAPDSNVGPSPMNAPIVNAGAGWLNSFRSGKGGDTITSGLEGAWTTNPAKWDHGFFHNLYKYEWKLTKGSGGAYQWIPTDPNAQQLVPDAHDPTKKHPPMMFTTDLALREDPIYGPISKRFHDDPKAFEMAFKKAWYKLTHRDMGPKTRCLGPLVPEEQLWQDPVPAGNKSLSANDIKDLKAAISATDLTTAQLVRTAWASASTFRCTDFRGGANGARIRLAPQKDWEVNDPAELKQILDKLETVKKSSGKCVSTADMIVLAGCVAIEKAAKAGGVGVTVPFTPGRGDAMQEKTDVASFAVLEPTADGFRNYKSTVHQLVDRAHMLSLTAPEMSVLLAGLRVLGANAGGTDFGVLTDQPGVLTNDFFVNLLAMGTSNAWNHRSPTLFESKSPTGKTWTATEVDLAFAANAELRAISEHYACDDSKEMFVKDFVKAWTKVMNLDQY
jgi:catalase-peroxidase